MLSEKIEHPLSELSELSHTVTSITHDVSKWPFVNMETYE